MKGKIGTKKNINIEHKYTFMSMLTIGIISPQDLWYKSNRQKIINSIIELDYNTLNKFLRKKNYNNENQNLRLLYLAYSNLKFLKFKNAIEFLKLVDIRRKNKHKSQEELKKIIKNKFKK